MVRRTLGTVRSSSSSTRGSRVRMNNLLGGGKRDWVDSLRGELAYAPKPGICTDRTRKKPLARIGRKRRRGFDLLAVGLSGYTESPPQKSPVSAPVGAWEERRWLIPRRAPA